MGHVFVSYATPDHRTASDVCNFIEKNGLIGWIAPRNVPKGAAHSAVIPDALSDAVAVVVLFSEATNESNYVVREIDTAVSQGKPIVPIRLRDVTPSRQLRYLLSSYQWIEAYREPTDVWRAHLLAALTSKQGAEFTKKSYIERDISLSPIFLLASFVAFLLALVAAIASYFRGPENPLCSLGSLDTFSVCATDKYVLTLLFAGLFSASILVPAVLTQRYRYRPVEWRDFLIFLTCGALMLVGVLVPIWTIAVFSPIAIVSYIFFWRQWLNLARSRTAVLIVIAVFGIASALEGFILENWSRTSGSALVLFDNTNHPKARTANIDYSVFSLVRDALEISVKEVLVTPVLAPTKSDFQDKFRRVDSDTGLGPQFQRSVLELRPFHAVFVADVRETTRCGVTYALVMVGAKRYRLGASPFWSWGSPSSFHAWKPFSYEAELDRNGDITNPGLVQALVAVHIIRWMAMESIEDKAAPPPLAQALLLRAEKNVLAYLVPQLQGRSCESADATALCKAASTSVRSDRQELMDTILADHDNTSAEGKVDDSKWSACAETISGEHELASRSGFGGR